MFKFGIFVCLAAVLAGQGLVLCNLTGSFFKIYKNGKPACLATAIAKEIPEFPPSLSPTEVLVTAAHCVRGVPPSALTIKKRTGNITTDVPVSQVILHPFYKPPNVNYDIAVLKMTQKVDSGIKSGESPNHNSSLEAVTDVTYTNITTMNATAIGLRACQTRLGNSIKLSSKMLCAEVRLTMDGSPLISPPISSPISTIFGVAFFSSQGIGVFTNMANSEIYSFVKKYL